MAIYRFRRKGGAELEQLEAKTIIDAFQLALDHLLTGEAEPWSIADEVGGMEFDQRSIFRVYRNVKTPP
jgi:hypothetical protein